MTRFYRSVVLSIFISVMAAAQTTIPFAAPSQEKPPVRTGTTGALQGRIKDDTGGVIPGASVTLTDETGQTQTVKSSADGSYSFRRVAPGNYTVTAAYTGLQQSTALIVSIAAGQSVSGDIVMRVKTQREEVTVTDASNNQVSTEAANNSSALVLRQEDLDALPDDPDDLEADLQALAGPAAGPGGNQIFIDGFTGGRMPPKASIREIRINSNPFSSEYDKLGYGRIEIFTKPGSDKFHGQGYYGMSDDVWNSRNPFLTTTPPFRTQLFGGNLSGGLGKKGSFFVDVDRRNIDDNGIINATLPSASFTGTQPFQSYYATPQRRTTVSPRVDFQLGPNNTLSMRYAYLENDQLLTGIGKFNLPATSVGTTNFSSNGYTQSANEHLFQLVDTAVLNPRVINETHFQYARDWVGNTSQSTLPELNVTNAFVAGGSGYSAPGYAATFDSQNQFEIQNYTSVTSGTHVIKFGVRVRTNRIDDFAPRNFNGTYSFLGSSQASSIQQYLTTVQLLSAGYTSAQVTALGFGPSQYSVSSGKPDVRFSQTDVGPFIQDEWRLRPNFTVSAGLRYEAQTNIGDKNDWAPRLAIAWSPDAKSSRSGRAKTVIRAGWGMFYDRFQVTNVLNAYRYNGSNQLTYLLKDPATYDGSFSTALPLSSLQLSNVSQRYEIDSNLKAPRIMQTAVGIERQLLSHTTLAVNFMNSRGVHELRTVDINAPLPGTYTLGSNSNANGVRPYGNIGDIYLYESSGIFKQTQLLVSLNTQIGKRVTLFSRYAYGLSHSDTDGISTMPSNPYDFSQDWGRSSLDIRNLLFVGGSITGPWGLRLSPFFVAHSGAPFNITTGTDLYQTGQALSTARPSIVSTAGPNVVTTPYGLLDVLPQPGQTLIERNYASGPSFVELNLRLSKTWSFGTTKFEGMSGGSRAQQGGGPPGGGGPGGGGPGGGGPGGGGGGGRGPGGGGFGGGPGGGGPPPGMFGETSARRYNLTLSIMARNALNHENLNAPVGVVTSPVFLQSTAITGGFGPENVASNQRRIDLQLRFSF